MLNSLLEPRLLVTKISTDRLQKSYSFAVRNLSDEVSSVSSMTVIEYSLRRLLVHYKNHANSHVERASHFDIFDLPCLICYQENKKLKIQVRNQLQSTRNQGSYEMSWFVLIGITNVVLKLAFRMWFCLTQSHHFFGIILNEIETLTYS